MDLDPFEPLGIAAPTLRFLDIFLLHCLLAESPPDTPEEIAALGRNQHRTAAYGRQPGLKLERVVGPATREVTLVEWADEILHDCVPIAAALDARFGGSEHARVLADARAALSDPERLPSARVLATMQRDFGGSYTAFIRAQAEQTRNALLALPWAPAQQATFEALARRSLDAQRAIEAADTVDFETWRQAYLAPERLLA